ncbi:MAG: sigma-70 family RNA polymerase sigma factor [Verrucomicrobiaceae bacterium]|nr:sigma-70 family RNA polymerase sigma factor [Verrucomicrobiaceae bacterium]
MDFPDTQWTVLAQATLRGGDPERAALDRLCRDYWRPVWACVRSRVHQPERADDLTQDFFVHLMERGFFRKAEAGRGHFRSFLVGALRFFLAEELRRSQTQKSGGHLEQCELNEDAATEPADDLAFDREWAQTMLDRAFGAVEAGFKEARGEEGWRLLRTFLPGSSAAAPSYESLAEALGMSVGGAKAEVFRLRQKFRETIRREVGRTVESPHEVDEELAHLRAVLSAGLSGLE